jgi:hypothetical protein
MLYMHLRKLRDRKKEQWKSISARQKEKGNVEIKIMLC